MIKTYSPNVTTHLSDLEIETITNFLVRESIDIIGEEVDYFFLCRESLVETILDGVSLDKVDIRSLRNQLNKVLYTKEEVKLLIQKIEKRIRKEIQMVKWDCNFKLNLTDITWSEPGSVVLLLNEDLKTLLYSATMAKAVDMAWLKMRKQLVPAAFNKLIARVKVGDMVLSSVKVNPGKLKADLKLRINKLIKGSIKQYKARLCRDMCSQVRDQLFNIKQLAGSDSEQKILIQVQSA